MNPMKILQMKSDFMAFNQRHPKVVQFCKVLGVNGIHEGSVMELSVTSPEGEKVCANLKVTAEDMELLQKIKDLKN